MTTERVRKNGVAFILGMITLMGTNSLASAQGRQAARGRGQTQQSGDRGATRQQQYQQQQVQNQQRFEQRQQNYQSFHQQRMQTQQGNEQLQPKRQDQQMQYSQRQLNDRERQVLQSQHDNWDKSERSWQSQYNSRWPQAQTNFERSGELLRQRDRSAQYSFQQAYWDRVREDHDRLQGWQFYNDVALDYSYLRGGQYYYTSAFGMNMLNDAVNDGYQQGFLAGQADREDGSSFDYADGYAYQDASYGYNGYWVEPGEYKYYFQKGFQDGYDDGYYNRNRYGGYTNGNYLINGSVLRGLINFSFIG